MGGLELGSNWSEIERPENAAGQSGAEGLRKMEISLRIEIYNVFNCHLQL